MSDNTVSSVLGYAPKKVGKVSGGGKKKSLPKDVSPVVSGGRDSVEISSAAASKLSSKPPLSDMARYLAMLRQLPEVRPDNVQRAKDAMAGGVYGEEALHATATGVAEDLGIPID